MIIFDKNYVIVRKQKAD